MSSAGAAGTARPINRRSALRPTECRLSDVGLKADPRVRDQRVRGWHGPSLPAVPHMPPNHRAHHARRKVA